MRGLIYVEANLVGIRKTDENMKERAAGGIYTVEGVLNRRIGHVLC